MKDRSYQKVAFSIVALAFLPGCLPFDWIKRKLGGTPDNPTVERMVANSSDGSPVLITINGQAAMTMNEFAKELDEFVEKNRLKPILQAGLIPDFEQQFVDGQKAQLTIDEDIKIRGVDQTSEYKKELDQIVKTGKQMLNAKYFTEQHPVNVSEKEKKTFYEENKDKLPEVILSQGGVNVVGIKFDNEKDAEQFFTTVKNKPDQFIQEAKAAKLEGKIKDFNLVNEQTVALEPEVRAKVLAYEKFPTTELIKVSDKSCWVVQAKEKKGAQCRPFEEVKATIEQYVNRQKKMDVLKKELSKLEEQYHVVVNKSLLKNKSEMPEETALNELKKNEPFAATA